MRAELAVLVVVLLAVLTGVSGKINHDPHTITLKGAFSDEGVPLFISPHNSNYVFTANHNNQTKTLTVYSVIIADPNHSNSFAVTGFMDILNANCPHPIYIDLHPSTPLPFHFLIQCPSTIYRVAFTPNQSSPMKVVGFHSQAEHMIYLGTDVTIQDSVTFLGPSPSYPQFYQIQTLNSVSLRVELGHLVPFAQVSSPNNVLSSLSFSHALRFVQVSWQLINWQYVSCQLSTTDGLCRQQESDNGTADFYYYFPVEVEGITAVKLRNSVNGSVLGVQRFNLLNGKNEGAMFMLKNLTQLPNRRFVQSTLGGAEGQYSLFLTVEDKEKRSGVSQVEFNNVGQAVSHNEVFYNATGPVAANSNYVVFWTNRIQLTRLSYTS